MITNGTAEFTDFSGFLSWYKNLPLLEAKDFEKKISETQKEKYRDNPIPGIASDFFHVRSWCSYPPSETEEAKWPGVRAKKAPLLESFYQMATEYMVPIRVGEWHEGLFAYLYLGNPNKGILVPAPEKYLRYIPETDYSDITPAQLRAKYALPFSAPENALVPREAEMTLTVKGVREQVAEQEAAQGMLKAQMDDVKNARTSELAQLQAQIEAMKNELEAKKTALMEQLREKLDEMQEMKENLENQIFLLDSQIYAIRCFAGEVVKFGQLRKGRNAADTSPIVIYQKLHFLDEDLGRLASLYTLDWENIDMFENFLKHSPVALENFAPNERCISLVRLSRDNKLVGKDWELPHLNMLCDYEYLHGKTVGIIIRNGENLYIGWTDDQRIHIEDDLILSGSVVTAAEPADLKYDYEIRQEREKQKQIRKKIMDGIVSRSFVYNILQGVVEHTPILPLPSGVSLGKQSEYVVYAIADKWLSDSRFGSFNDIVNRCNEKLNEGDQVLMMQSLRPERYDGWGPRNVRGRGWNNRTHDVSAQDCTIYPINLIEYDPPITWVIYKRDIKDGYSYKTKKEDAANISPECVIVGEEVEQKRHIYISLTKRWSYSDARANMEIYRDEYMNLTYMNSVWLTWVITNKDLGGWGVGGKKVNYAYAIRYLKTALDFVKERETEEKTLIDAVDPAICHDPDWPLHLTEWKLEKGVRKITPYQAKRFATHIGKEKE